MRHLRSLALGLAALAAVTAVGCCHSCGGPPAAEQRGYYSPCGTPACGTPACGTPAPVPGAMPPTGYPTSAVPGAPYPNGIR